MGIIKATSKALGDSLADQWLDEFYCERIPDDLLTVKGAKKTGGRSSNTQSNPNVISNGSLIIVNDGQCAITAEQGKVLDIFEEPGEHKFYSELSGSIFGKDGIRSIAKQTWERIGYGGETHITQAVYYLSLLEHTGNPFATIVPIRVKAQTLDMDCSVLVSGVFSFKITQPAVFYKYVCGNRARVYKVKEILPQLTAEIIPVIVETLNAFCEDGKAPHELVNNIEEICAATVAAAREKWSELRGFSMVDIAFDTIRVLEQAEMQRVQYYTMLKDPQMAAATLIGTQANAMQHAAENGGGLAFGAAVIGNSDNMFLKKSASDNAVWYCPCGKMNRTAFCENCGRKRP